MKALGTYLSLLFILGAIVPAQAVLEPTEAQSLFQQANTAFHQGHAAVDSTIRKTEFQRAILAYERLIHEGGIQNAQLYYNLANTYLLQGNLGLAIANYRRAENLDPSDANIHKNLSFARSQRVDTVALGTKQRVRQTLFFWHYDVSPKNRFLLSCLSFGLLCLLVSSRIKLGRHSEITAAGVLATVLLVAMAGSLAVETATESDRFCGVITSDAVVARQGDGINYPESFKDPLHAGTEFDLLEQRNGWLRIRLADDSEAWIPDKAAEII